MRSKSEQESHQASAFPPASGMNWPSPAQNRHKMTKMLSPTNITEICENNQI